MKTFSNKISIRQIYIMFFIGVCSPLIRILPIQLSRKTDGAVWISPFLSLIMFIFLVLIINRIFKNNKEKNLSEIMDDVLRQIHK